jgi:hypothetical protein
MGYYSRLFLKYCAYVAFVAGYLLFVLALFTFDSCDPSPWCDVASSGRLIISNGAGKMGAFCASIAFWLFGFCAFFLLPLVLTSVALWVKSSEKQRDFGRLAGWICILTGSSMLLYDTHLGNSFHGNAGGILGNYLFHLAARATDSFLAFGFAGIILVIGLILVIRFAWVSSAYPVKALFFPITITLSALAFCQSLCISFSEAIKNYVTALFPKRTITPENTPLSNPPREREIIQDEENLFWKKLCTTRERPQEELSSHNDATSPTQPTVSEASSQDSTEVRP